MLQMWMEEEERDVVLVMILVVLPTNKGFPGGPAVMNLPANAGHTGSIPGSGRSPGEGNGYPLQYSCLENLMNRGAWHATVHGLQSVGHNLVTNNDCIRQFTLGSSLMYYLHVVNRRVLELEIA